MRSTDFAEAAFGLFVGVTQFKDSLYVDKPLDVAERDAEDLRGELLKRFAWKENHIETLTGQVTREHVTQGLRRMKERIRDFGGSAVFLLYISTHGHLYLDHAGRADRSCLLAHNTDTSDSTTIFDTALTGPLLETYVGSLDAAEVLVILDTCYADRALKVDELVKDVLPQGAGAAVLAAAAGLASYSEKRRNSDATETLLLALRRLGSQQGAISLARLLSELENGEGGTPWALYSAIRGALRIGFAGEAVELRTLDFETLHELAAARVNAYIAGARNYVAAKYVPRLELEAKFRRFLSKAEDPSVFTIVGAAGSGKTTTSLRLAEAAKNKGFAVVWVPSSEAAPGAGFWKVLRDTFDKAGYWGSDVHVLEALRHAGKPLVLVLDAVNEWEAEASAKKAFLADCTKYASEGRLKLVLTCRTRDWSSVTPLLPQTTSIFEERRGRSSFGQSQSSEDNQGDRVSAVLGPFQGNELGHAEAIFGTPGRVDAPELRKQPIFVRILSQLSERLPLPDRDGVLHFISVFDAFFNYRLEQAAAQVAESADSLRHTVMGLVGTMYERDGESLSTEAFLDLAKETLGLALLESGLFRRVGSSVAVEAEMVHEYLLSLHLAGRTVSALKQAAAGGVNRRLLQGAVLFDLVRIDDPQIVIPVLENLYKDDPFVALDLMPRLSRLSEYQEFFIQRVKSFGYGVAEKLRFVLERDAPGDLSFTVGVIRGVFHDEHYYDWERKRWEPGTWEDFKIALKRTHFESAMVLAEAVEKEPDLTMRLLIRDWLPDQSYLREGITRIRDVGMTFLCAAGRLYPETFAGIVQGEIDRAPSELWDALREVVPVKPELFKDLVARWLEEGRMYPAMSILSALPERYADFAVEQVSMVIRVRNLDSGTLQSLFGLLARFGGVKILRFLQESLQKPRLRIPVLETLRYMRVADPSLLLEIVEPLLHEDRLDQMVLNALAGFYVDHMDAAPEAAVKVFRQALKKSESHTEFDIAWGVSRQGAHQAVTDFVHERLAESPHHNCFEFYSYYLRRLGPFGEQDLPWLRKSAASEGLPPLLADIASAALPFSEKSAMLLLIEKHHPSWWTKDSEPGDTANARAFVRALIDHQDFAAFRDETHVWLRAVADGKTWNEAVDEVWGKT
jgi:Caspase domain